MIKCVIKCFKSAIFFHKIRNFLFRFSMYTKRFIYVLDLILTVVLALYSQIKSMLVKELDVLLLVFPVSVVVEPTDLAKLPSVTCAEEDGKKINM